MNDIVTALNGVIWSRGLIYLCLGVGLYFSIRTRFMQVRGIGEMLRLMFNNRRSDAGVSSFQALAMSLAGRVGIGNIAGVATAISYGGPGAVFWMWTVAFLGASTAYIESTLGQIYKEKDDAGRYRGGPAYYIEKAMGQKWYAWTFAFATVVATGLLLPGVQANGIAVGVQNAWGVSTLVTSACLVVTLGVIIIGGVTRIAAFAEIVVPFMALAYILMAVVIMALNAAQIPEIMVMIVRGAFGMDAAFGGMLGLAIEWGVRRGVYSNEAGQGTGPHAAAAAEVSHPAEQGYVQAFSIYVDTLLVCSATAFMILSTGTYNVQAPDGTMIVNRLPGVETGPAFTQAAVDSMLPGIGASFVALALMFFAFTTIVAYYYMAETNIQYINRKQHRPWTLVVLKVAIMGSVAVGAVRSASTAWALGDLGVGLMAWLNIIAILILQKPALVALRDYESQKRKGVKPVFDPAALGIRGADLWRRPGLVIMLVLAVLGAACRSTPATPPPAAAAAVSADTWATIDDRAISREDVERAFRRARDLARPLSPEEELTAKLTILDELILENLLMAKAAALKIDVPTAELDTAYTQARSNIPEQAFQEELTRRNVTAADMREGLRRQILSQKVLEREVTGKVAVSDKEISDFFNANRAQFNLAEDAYRVAQIVITAVREPRLANRTGDDATTAEAAAQKSAMLMEKLKGGATFTDLARDYSEDPESAPRGGDLGFMPLSAVRQAPPALRDAVLTTMPGTVRVVTLGGDRTLVLLVAKEPAGQRELTTAGVREGIINTLRGRKEQLMRTAYLTALRNDAAVVNYLARRVVETQGVL